MNRIKLTFQTSASSFPVENISVHYRAPNELVDDLVTCYNARRTLDDDGVFGLQALCELYYVCRYNININIYVLWIVFGLLILVLFNGVSTHISDGWCMFSSHK